MAAIGMHFRWRVTGVAVLAALGGCGNHGDLPVQAPSIRVAEDHPLADVLWPSLLQHCRRNPSCDPMSAFGVGAGEASGVAVYSTWFAESADVLDNGDEFGARIRVSLGAYRGVGGEAGRPLSPIEREANLRAYRDAQSRLTVEYREQNDEFIPYFVSVRTQQVVLEPAGVDAEMSREEIVSATRALVEGWVWPDGGVGAEIELAAAGEVLFAERSVGAPSRTVWKGEEPEAIGFEPWVFSVQAPIDADSALLGALMGEDFIRLTVRTPDGRVVFSDSFAAGGHRQALGEARTALADLHVRLPLTERCAPFADWDNDTWAKTSVSPAQKTCDPLTSISRQRILDQQPSASPE